MVRIETEWDIGTDNVVFANMAAAMAWLETSEILGELSEDNEMSIADFINEGLISFQPIQLIQ
jgi:hypothetical protein